jgi:hypothetical protein
VNHPFGRAALAILTVALFVFAGCSGKKNEIEPPISTGPADPHVTADTGAIAGLVVSEEVIGISRAELLVQETQDSTRSGEDGRFTINGLVPGTYTLLVSALGYESGSARIDVFAGEISEKTFTLAAIAVKSPHHEAIPFAGQFQCSVALVDTLWSACGPEELASEEPASQIKFEKPEGVTYMVAELHWTQASAGTGQNLDFNIVQQGRDEEQWYANNFGPAPLTIAIEIGEKYSNPKSPGGGVGSDEFDQVIDDEDTLLQLDLYSSPVYSDEMFPGTQHEATVGLTLEQKFEGFITFFYDEVPPEEYSAFGDA